MRSNDLETYALQHIVALGLQPPVAHPILLLERAHVPVVLPGRSKNQRELEISVDQPHTVPWQMLLGYAQRAVCNDVAPEAFARALAAHCDQVTWIPDYPAGTRARLRVVR